MDQNGKICNDCMNNRLSARIRRLITVLKPAQMTALPTPLEVCLKKYGNGSDGDHR